MRNRALKAGIAYRYIYQSVNTGLPLVESNLRAHNKAGYSLSLWQAEYISWYVVVFLHNMWKKPESPEKKETNGLNLSK